MLQDLRSLRLTLPPTDWERGAKLIAMEQSIEKAQAYLRTYFEDAERAKKELDKNEMPGPLGRLNARFQRLR